MGVPAKTKIPFDCAQGRLSLRFGMTGDRNSGAGESKPSFARHGPFGFAQGRLARAPVPTRATPPYRWNAGTQSDVLKMVGQTILSDLVKGFAYIVSSFLHSGWELALVTVFVKSSPSWRAL